MIVKLLTEQHLEFLSFKGGFTGSYESTFVKMPHCLKSRVTAQVSSHTVDKCIGNKIPSLASILMQSEPGNCSPGVQFYG